TRAVAPTQDTFALLAALDDLWRRVEPELEAGRLSYVGVGVHGLKARDAFEADLFDIGPDQGGAAPSLRLSQALNAINKGYGDDTVCLGSKAGLRVYSGGKSAFSRILEEAGF